MIPAKHNSNLVLIQNKVKVSDPQWGDTVTWPEFRQVWVSISPNRGREVFKGDELSAVVSHTIRGDFLELEGVTETMRLIYHESHVYDPMPASALVFDLLAVLPDYDHSEDIMIQASLKALRFGDLPPDIPQ